MFSASKILKILSHPLFLLMIGAIITSAIIPSFTRQWQDHQKELEVKIALGNELNKAISDFWAINLLSTYPILANKTDTASAWVAWKASSAEIASKIDGYFSDKQLVQDWNNLTASLDQHTQLFTTDYPLPFQGHSLDPSGFGFRNYSFYYDRVFCTRVSNVLFLHKIFPQTNPINMNKEDLKVHGCNNFSLQGLDYADQASHYYPVKNKNDIDWYTLIYFEGSTANLSAIKSREDSLSNLDKYIDNSKSRLLDKIYRSNIDVFR